MHETRNLVIIILLIIAAIWAFMAWFVFSQGDWLWWHRLGATGATMALGAWCWYALNVEDKLPDHLAAKVGPMYYEADGLSFMPVVRVNEKRQAELALYYQNRFENYVHAVVHLRPLEPGFRAKQNVSDLHFTFKADGGDFGVLHQPIGVPDRMQGRVIEVHMAAVTRFPRSHGARLRSHEGMPCGSFAVDWQQAFKVGVHEVSGEIALVNPVTLHLTMPADVNERITGSDQWKQELLAAGPSEYAVMG